MKPQTRYALSKGVHIGYQVFGEGPIDLVFVTGWVFNIEYAWEESHVVHFLNRLASISRVIMFDKRGTGTSDKVSELPTLEQRMDDVRAVMDAVGSERAALLGVSEGGPMSALFAATYPERTMALVIYGSYAKRLRSEDYPWAPSLEERLRWFDLIEKDWGGTVDLDTLAPSMAEDEQFSSWWATCLRMSASPKDAVALARMNTEIDIRRILSSIHVPTLVLHRIGDQDITVGNGKYLADNIPQANFVELSGSDHLPWVGNADLLLDEVEEFLTGVRPSPMKERVLATVLFTDLVGSTQKAAEIGDARWRDLLARHNSVARREFSRYRGREVKSTGDGFLVTFDGPARAIGCALALRDGLKPLGLDIRAGLHTGECELIGDDVSGLAVHLAARVMAEAQPKEVLASNTVKDLVAGSGIKFDDRGIRQLRGIPGEWHLFSVSSGDS